MKIAFRVDYAAGGLECIQSTEHKTQAEAMATAKAFIHFLGRYCERSGEVIEKLNKKAGIAAHSGWILKSPQGGAVAIATVEQVINL